MTYKKVFCDLYEPRKANVLTCKMKPWADFVYRDQVYSKIKMYNKKPLKGFLNSNEISKTQLFDNDQQTLMIAFCAQAT